MSLQQLFNINFSDDDLSLLCPSFTGIKEMLIICEKYARKYDILFIPGGSNHFRKIEYLSVLL